MVIKILNVTIVAHGLIQIIALKIVKCNSVIVTRIILILPVPILMEMYHNVIKKMLLCQMLIGHANTMKIHNNAMN